MSGDDRDRKLEIIKNAAGLFKRPAVLVSQTGRITFVTLTAASSGYFSTERITSATLAAASSCFTAAMARI